MVFPFKIQHLKFKIIFTFSSLVTNKQNHLGQSQQTTHNCIIRLSNLETYQLEILLLW